MALQIVSVDENTPARRMGLAPGTQLVAIDGKPLRDALDYQFYSAATRFTLTVCRDGVQTELTVEKDRYEIVSETTGSTEEVTYDTSLPVLKKSSN